MNEIPVFSEKLNGDRVAVKRLDDERVSKGGIIIPDTATEKSIKGIILALGEEITHSEENGLRKAYCPFYIGQTITFGKYAGTEITGEDGKEYLIMRETDILSYKTKS